MARPVVDFDSLVLAVNAYSAGDAVRLMIRRGDKTIEVHRPGQVPRRRRGRRHQSPQAMARPARRLHQHASFPAYLAPICSDSSRIGVVVTEIEEGIAGRRRGIKKGQLIEVRGPSLRPRDFSEAVAGAKAPSSSRPTWPRDVQ